MRADSRSIRAMSDPSHEHRPVSGSCSRCGCPLSFVASRVDDEWFCCGACAGSDRCCCGCKPELKREISSDAYVPARRMFAARHPDELRTEPGYRDRARAFPFANSKRGR